MKKKTFVPQVGQDNNKILRSIGYTKKKIDILKKKKTPLVKKLFGEVSENYDLMNDIMSLGVHRIWKNNLIDWMAPRLNYHLLDLAGGTGDIALGFLNRGGGKATIADLNFQMLSVGKQKNSSISVNDNLSWLACNGENLPFNDNNFDIVSISFGLRNITHKSIALNEIFRVLKPGGRFMCLEFSKVNISILNRFYQIWSSRVCLLYTSPSPRDATLSRMPSSA